MLDIKRLEAEFEAHAERLATRRVPREQLEAVQAVNERRKSSQRDYDERKNLQSQLGPQLAKAKKAGEDASALEAQLKELKEGVKQAEVDMKAAEEELRGLLLMVPNLPHPEAPLGGEEDGVVRRTEGQPKTFEFTPKDHVAICDATGLVEFGERATRLAGASFVVYMGQGARLTRALINFFLDLHTSEHGYTEVSVPFLVNQRTLTGTGQWPKFAEDMFTVTADGLYLIPTAEVPVTNLHQQEVLAGEDLPLAYCAYTPCFRREAGSAGKMTRGLKRLHQFDKVELVRFCRPEDSDAEHQKLLRHAEEPLKRLGLHYRIKELATGDIGFSAARCYDIEAHAPGSDEWLEVSSVSTFTDYQARRAEIRFKDKQAPGEKKKPKPREVHTLNGSGLALPRVIIAILETYQQQDGSVVVPEALRPYMGGLEVLGGK